MGNCLSKVPESITTIVDRVKREFVLLGKHRFMPREISTHYLNNDRKLEIITPAADRFPNQTCNLIYNEKVNRFLDRLMKGRDRARLMQIDLQKDAIVLG